MHSMIHDALAVVRVATLLTWFNVAPWSSGKTCWTPTASTFLALFSADTKVPTFYPVHWVSLAFCSCCYWKLQLSVRFYALLGKYCMRILWQWSYRILCICTAASLLYTKISAYDFWVWHSWSWFILYINWQPILQLCHSQDTSPGLYRTYTQWVIRIYSY